MREKWNQFMQGRYGYDDLSRFLMKVFIAAIILSLFTGRIYIAGVFSLGRVFYWIALILIVYSYFRMFSKNIYKRSQENLRFLEKTRNIRNFFSTQQNLMKQRKKYHIYTCPDCKQKIRIPRGKGKIEIRCPKCGRTFIKRS
ncbi:zinc-ribbon domain-containing protein [Anaerostipes sp. MSJ-23]|uniref:zinc-ribbon domain-containing protein n=1 Tax=Anaerostipes sp. MSJ-23 TaxID=2841520 RepID=UPI001C12848E|nr:zinc-ribbon domain-containing protein [Anaerostipes sp. MSJ-23]MBU5459647.1 zinc-ribbon domain-containing protein [Anaerostipes sp. MSJ-23]